MSNLFDDPGQEATKSSEPTPTRVCPHCSTQSQTAGDFCPQCGKSFVRRARLGKRAKRVLVATLALLLVGGGGTAVALKLKHDSDAKAERARQAKLADERKEREARERRREAEEQRREEEAQEALDEIELDARRDLERGLRKSITKDAREQVANGLLEGPILRTVCNPVGGGRDDLEARTGKYECMAVTEEESDGSYRGWEFSGTINYDKFSWAWELGD